MTVFLTQNNAGDEIYIHNMTVFLTRNKRCRRRDMQPNSRSNHCTDPESEYVELTRPAHGTEPHWEWCFRLRPARFSIASSWRVEFMAFILMKVRSRANFLAITRPTPSLFISNSFSALTTPSLRLRLSGSWALCRLNSRSMFLHMSTN